MTKGENGVWEVTLGPIDPGAYRYNFNVDGVPVIDPRNPSTSESNTNTWSLVYVPGSDFIDTTRRAARRGRRGHLLLDDAQPLPAAARLHAAGLREPTRRSTRSSTCCTAPATATTRGRSVGRAGFILDNLIAAKKAKPMIVVMPAGHTRAVGGGMPANDEFDKDFLTDIMPTVEKRYRVVDRPGAPRDCRPVDGRQPDAEHRHPAARQVRLRRRLQLGPDRRVRPGAPGAGAPPPPPPAPGTPNPWEQQNLAALDNAAAKKGLKLLWFATGKDDFLLQTTRATVDLLKKHGFTVVYEETDRRPHLDQLARLPAASSRRSCSSKARRRPG